MIHEPKAVWIVIMEWSCAAAWHCPEVILVVHSLVGDRTDVALTVLLVSFKHYWQRK